MKELTFETLIAVMQEMFGPVLFWALVVAVVATTLGFLYVVIRDRKILSSRFLRAELLAPVGAVAAVAFVMMVTNSGLGDIGGPIDVITVVGIALAGAGGLTILVYTLTELLFPPKERDG